MDTRLRKLQFMLLKIGCNKSISPSYEPKILSVIIYMNITGAVKLFSLRVCLFLVGGWGGGIQSNVAWLVSFDESKMQDKLKYTEIRRKDTHLPNYYIIRCFIFDYQKQKDHNFS